MDDRERLAEPRSRFILHPWQAGVEVRLVLVAMCFCLVQQHAFWPEKGNPVAIRYHSGTRCANSSVTTEHPRLGIPGLEHDIQPPSVGHFIEYPVLVSVLWWITAWRQRANFAVANHMQLERREAFPYRLEILAGDRNLSILVRPCLDA